MPRPKNPAAPTSTERARASRERHGMRSIMLPAAVIAALDAQRAPGETRVAALTRVIGAAPRAE